MVEDPPQIKERMKLKLPIDFTGLVLVASGVGCMEFFLDKGQEKDWFGDPMIRTVAILASVLIVTFVWWEWRHPDPIVDLKLLQNRNFGTAVFLQLILGMVLFSSTVLIPQYLQTLLGYTAERAGEVLSPAGFVMMLGMFLAGRSLGTKIDPRADRGDGVHRYRAGHSEPYAAYARHQLRQCDAMAHAAGGGTAFIFIPISTLNYVGVPRSKSNQISSLSNFARNLGGSAGTALLTTFSGAHRARRTSRRWPAIQSPAQCNTRATSTAWPGCFKATA